MSGFTQEVRTSNTLDLEYAAIWPRIGSELFHKRRNSADYSSDTLGRLNSAATYDVKRNRLQISAVAFCNEIV
jgi:hypothetical protein